MPPHQTRRFWQPPPEALQGERLWRQKLDCLHTSPCRKGRVCSPNHGRYSSAAWYLSDGVQAIDVPLTALVW